MFFLGVTRPQKLPWCALVKEKMKLIYIYTVILVVTIASCEGATPKLYTGFPRFPFSNYIRLFLKTSQGLNLERKGKIITLKVPSTAQEVPSNRQQLHSCCAKKNTPMILSYHPNQVQSNPASKIKVGGTLGHRGMDRMDWMVGMGSRTKIP